MCHILLYGEFMEALILMLEKVVWSIPLVLLLVFTHAYFTVKLKFPQRFTFIGIKNMLNSDKNNTDEGISSFKSIMTVLAATLGTGNIIGVATAILIGGVGSIFWIFVSGVLAIATKYAETYIVLKYRKKDKNGYYGGTMYVLDEKIGNKKLAIYFSILLILTTFGMGSMIQSNAISSTIIQNYSVDLKLIGIVVTILCGYVLFGNEKRISNISSILIPVAVIIYILSCVYLIWIYKENLMPSIVYITKEALNFKAMSGGILASSAIAAMSNGLSKGLFTNEAGMGTSPIFDCTVKEQDIKKQSIMSSTAVFIDTVFLCTITGILFVASGGYLITSNPVEFAQGVFMNLPCGKFIFTFMITIFAVSTIPCSGFYGSVGIRYIFNSKKIYNILYKVIFLVFVYIGAISKIQVVWSISSIANALMVIPNLLMLFYLKDEIE